MDIVRYVVMVVSFCLVLSSCGPAALRAQTQSPTAQEQLVC